MRKNLYTYIYLIIILTISYIFLSCASKMPALYKDGKPLTIIEYDKIAQKEFDNNRFDNAITAYEAIITNYPDKLRASTWAHYEIGFCYYVKEEYDKAEIYFRKVTNEFQEPAAKKLARDMLAKIVEAKNKKKK